MGGGGGGETSLSRTYLLGGWSGLSKDGMPNIEMSKNATIYLVCNEHHTAS